MALMEPAILYETIEANSQRSNWPSTRPPSHLSSPQVLVVFRHFPGELISNVFPTRRIHVNSSLPKQNRKVFKTLPRAVMMIQLVKCITLNEQL